MSTALYIDADIQASKYCNVGTFAVLVFDYCITLEAESQWVWHRKWTFVRFIFTISRYLPFVGIGMTFAAALRTQYYPGESCVGYGMASNALHIISIVAAEGLLIMRIHASWNSKRLLRSLLVFTVICVVSSYILSETSLVHITIQTKYPNTFIADPGSCEFMGGRNFSFNYVILLFYELVLFCLMLFIRITRYKHTVGRLQRTFFKDTMKYMIGIIFMSSLSIFFAIFPPPTLGSMTDSSQIVIHSVLASRILFNLRESEGRSGTQPEVDISEIQFEGGQLSTLRFGDP
ncbi:hypothetical protein DEU56DRAFT_114681 [Suillus clintonianus]|uniref:uncharacterized protein n=1 Tax=Suillus clintonianus TaxID=1904413 RepID=UPI001B86869F|nr:uncharacterized protein DEU56DRAFT_114681 [Suillus clintonianus]KAG2120249.1 hypothetical protein DEU56DRAFT_114681 [Suillus clintonianus]